MQKWIIAAVGVFILLVGGGMIGGSYFYDHVPRPEELQLLKSTEVFSADGVQIAKLGSEHRSEVPMAKLKEDAKHALIAGEDKGFYEHHGIDFWGIARAAWNNLTGGETQGASTITQQYARQAANDLEVTYARKLREAVMARKIEDQYSKEEILGFYLNTVYFGRGAHGVGAAYEAYFGKPADDIGNMTVAQAAVLGAVLKQPEGDNGFDPHVNPTNAKDRWAYVLNNMVDNKWLTPEAKAQLKYPAPANPEAPQPGELQLPKENSGGAWGYTDRGTGFVINRVADELAEKGVVKYLKDNGMGNWKDAGLRVTTTVEPKVQAALEQQLNRQIAGSTMSKQRENIVGAGVVINPTNGRVVAYYGGGNNGTGVDFAGKQAPHPPASSFKEYTLTAAIDAGISIKSHWNSRELKRSLGDPIDLTNANREGDPGCDTYCTLEDMTVRSFNVPFYHVAQTIGPAKVVAMANKLGVKTMWGIDGKAYDTSKGGPFDNYVGFGQYPITVMEHATGTATLAAGGVYRKPHFVVKVERKNKSTGAWERIPLGDEKVEPQQVIRREVAEEVTSVLKKIAPPLGGSWEAAGKTGTWENGLKQNGQYVYKNTNAHAWFTGYTSYLAATIWVGSKDENKTPIKVAGTGDLLKASNLGSAVPKDWWKQFMTQVNKDMAYKATKLPNGTGGRIGSEDRGDGKSPTPVAQDPQECNPMFPQFCPSKPPGGGGGGGGGGWPSPSTSPTRRGGG
jgi:membrane peptidoglycan carboxypeptidase